MLTGYGSMYLNESIKKEKKKYYATRNEATTFKKRKRYDSEH